MRGTCHVLTPAVNVTDLRGVDLDHLAGFQSRGPAVADYEGQDS